MSMLSAQADGLRDLALWLDDEFYDVEASKVRQAADTILELRDRLQRANTENAKLREELEQWHRLTAGIELPEYPVTQFQPKDLERENAKLRKLVQDLHKALFTLDIDHCQACPRDSINGPCTKFMACGSDECSIEEDMRELGIEEEDWWVNGENGCSGFSWTP